MKRIFILFLLFLIMGPIFNQPTDLGRIYYKEAKMVIVTTDTHFKHTYIEGSLCYAVDVITLDTIEYVMADSHLQMWVRYDEDSQIIYLEIIVEE